MRPAASSRGSERKLAPMTVSSPNVTEIKLDRLIEDMRLLRSEMIAFHRHLKGIEACLKTNEPNEQQHRSKSKPWFEEGARSHIACRRGGSLQLDADAGRIDI
jgi:hypothetical protein